MYETCSGSIFNTCTVFLESLMKVICSFQELIIRAAKLTRKYLARNMETIVPTDSSKLLKRISMCSESKCKEL